MSKLVRPRAFGFTRVRFTLAAAAISTLFAAGLAQAEPVTLNIASINNPDMIELQKLAPAFEKANPDIKLRWVTMEESVLRQRLTTDIATNSGQFDLMTIGAYEAPIWAKKGWLAPMTGLPADYDEADLIKPVREGLSVDGKLYALPFYAESSMTYYRKDLFEQKKLTMPQRPTWDEIAKLAAQLHDPAKGVYGICLRGRAGWGENMAIITTMANAWGGRWFDEQWQPQLSSPEWKKSVAFYVDLMRKYGPPGASSNGFNENLVLFSSGKCGMWVDATVAAGMLYHGKDSKVADKTAFAPSPMQVTDKGSHWLWIWSLAVPKSSKSQDAAKKFAAWATSKEYINLVAKDSGWALVPPGTRNSTYASAEYKKVSPFSDFVLDAIQTADANKPTVKPVPYTGVQFATIPEFQSIGTVTGQAIAGALAGKTTSDAALDAAQAQAVRMMRQGRYIK
ncbi:sugar ABC transporter substrate-binding protein [Herbaspirillum seropedicae]|uniref:ABC-type sugar transport system, periplasmic component protein n=2 Tax=Herbaspirillum seropedicae TaxID=964 RepID=D8IX90_HERSS|nr:sugar ABC transporter substrate-binding protein [Herbaspirillum seropedicae]ADJ61965.1 ABC-type sugar transport system, periplasmic component protein [Herbaspirillum seropedicae SmR1]AKN64148.1 sugar ABC transporter substrate-binding protein [Herbaspirillum seropedicae]NQE29534.1 sugar ABC transporter substrate-binding protein [Herbaspirillum seropedicae]UMU20059.1 sugar ABC transporter substrate-binding protein [Herbaspirillum seropedicae]